MKSSYFIILKHLLISRNPLFKFLNLALLLCKNFLGLHLSLRSNLLFLLFWRLWFMINLGFNCRISRGKGGREECWAFTFFPFCLAVSSFTIRCLIVFYCPQFLIVFFRLVCYNVLRCCTCNTRCLLLKCLEPHF